MLTGRADARFQADVAFVHEHMAARRQLPAASKAAPHLACCVMMLLCTVIPLVCSRLEAGRGTALSHISTHIRDLESLFVALR